MKRRYVRRDQRGVNFTRRHTKVQMISTNIIVGFPRRNPRRFPRHASPGSRRRLSLPDFPYEERPETPAAKFANKIPRSNQAEARNDSRMAVRKQVKHFRLVTTTMTASALSTIRPTLAPK
jgi:tRNA A37 methylthiotransferase MiaB